MTAATEQDQGDGVHRLDVSQVPHQKRFVKSQKKVVIISGSLGAGKTYPLCVKAFRATQEAPGSKVALVRKQLTDLKASTLNTLLEGDRETPPVIPDEYIVNHNKSEKVIEVLTPYDDTSKIVYSGLSSGASDRYPKKLGSTEFTDVAIDELEELTEADFNYLLGRLRRPKLDPDGNPIQKQVFAATNPGGPNHWVHQTYINPPQGRPDHVEVLFARTEDNPFLDDDYIETLKETYQGVMRKRLLEGQWVAAEGQVYRTWDREVHERDPSLFQAEWNVCGRCEKRFPERDDAEEHIRRKHPGRSVDIHVETGLRPYDQLVVGADAGYTNPRALAVIGITGNDEAHVIDEFYRSRTDIDAAIQWLDERPYRDRIDRIFHDPSEPGDIEALNQAGFDARKANNDIISGVSHMASKLGDPHDEEAPDPALFVHPQVTNWKNEIASYRYPQDGRRSDEKPLKENDHLMDATRYALMGVRSGGAGLAWTTV